MDALTLYESDNHLNVLLEDFGEGGIGVQANHHLIIDGGSALILDPGGHRAYPRVLEAVFDRAGKAGLTHIFLSHQDPDVVASLNGWLMTTDADAYCSSLWQRFVPHFGLDHLLIDRLRPIPDQGCFLQLGGAELMVVPAHFLHSCGNHQLYDPVSKTLYTGDLGASLGMEYREVEDFDAHIPYIHGFHMRYMGSSRALRAWVKMIRPLDIEVIAPQHGALFRGRAMVERFLDWCADLECGIDVMEDSFVLPVPEGLSSR